MVDGVVCERCVWIALLLLVEASSHSLLFPYVPLFDLPFPTLNLSVSVCASVCVCVFRTDTCGWFLDERGFP